jgi:hypothetical protein
VRWLMGRLHILTVITGTVSHFNGYTFQCSMDPLVNRLQVSGFFGFVGLSSLFVKLYSWIL